MHGGAGGKAVVHEDDRAATHVGGRAMTAIDTLATRELLLLPAGQRVDHAVGDAQGLHDFLIEDAHAARGDGAERVLLVPGDAQLAYDEDVQRRPQRARHFRGDGHAATRQREHQHVRALGVRAELSGEETTGFTAIAKALSHHLSPPCGLLVSSSTGPFWCMSDARRPLLVWRPIQTLLAEKKCRRRVKTLPFLTHWERRIRRPRSTRLAIPASAARPACLTSAR